MFRKNMKRALSLVSILAFTFTGIAAPWGTDSAQAAKKASLKTKKITVKAGKTKKIVIKGKVKKATYSFKSKNKKVATVSKAGLVKGKKAGKTTVTVTQTLKKKKSTIGKVTVTVKKASKPKVTPQVTPSKKPDVTPEATPDTTPITTPDVTPTAKPGDTPAPPAETKKPTTEGLVLEGEQLKPTTEDDRTNGQYTLNDDGSVEVKASWKYYAIALPKPLNLATVKSIELVGSASNKFRLSFGNKAGEYFIDHNNLDSWVYPEAFDGSTTLDLANQNPSGEADWLFIGCTTEDVVFNLTSINFTLGKATITEFITDGITETLKEVGFNNPIAAQRFLADPYAIEYNGTVYVYGTNDSNQMRIGEDGKIPANNGYEYINTLNCYSSKDMVNWTDEGIIPVAGKKGPASWAKNSWAPAVAYKNINGKDKFFIYFADNGSGSGVLEGDSPTGPFHDPLGKQLISRSTPNCAQVPWLFDPAVLVDDDGQGYLYFGGIGEAEDREHPKCIRVVKLGDDMISLAGDPVEIDAPAPFEDSGINKIDGKYYYSYCTNWNAGPTTKVLGTASIAYMVSDTPMGPWSEAKCVLKNPGAFFNKLPSNNLNNNHHCMLQRGDKLYMFYHSQKTAVDMGISGYRTTGVNYVEKDKDGNLTSKMDMEGVPGDKDFNPYDVVEAETFAWSEGTSTIVGPEQYNNRNNRVLSSISNKDYVGLDRVAFGEDGAQSVTMRIASDSKEKAEGTVEIYIDDMKAASKVGEIKVSADSDFKYIPAKLTKKITGTHKLFFKFMVKGILVDTWMFSKDAEPKEPAAPVPPAEK